MDQRRWTAAEAAFRARLASSGPSDYEGYLALGNFLVDTGRAREALLYLERAHQLDPLASIPLGRIGLAYDATGQVDRAMEAYREARALQSYDMFTYVPHFWSVFATSDEETARLVLVEAGVETMYDGFVARYEQHEQVFAAEMPPLTTTNVALMAAARGDSDVALQATRRTVLQSPAFLFNVWGPIMSDVRRRPEFAFLMSELELPAFWQANGWPEHCRPSEPEGFECD